jgi:hypothetical protein
MQPPGTSVNPAVTQFRQDAIQEKNLLGISMLLKELLTVMC